MYFLFQIFSSNLLSIGQLIGKRHSINISNGVYILSRKNKKMIAKVHMTKNRMFSMFLQIEILFNLKATIEDDNGLWHFHFGHLNFCRLKLLVYKNMVTKLPLIDVLDCVNEGCFLKN